MRFHGPLFATFYPFSGSDDKKSIATIDRKLWLRSSAAMKTTSHTTISQSYTLFEVLYKLLLRDWKFIGLVLFFSAFLVGVHFHSFLSNSLFTWKNIIKATSKIDLWKIFHSVYSKTPSKCYFKLDMKVPTLAVSYGQNHVPTIGLLTLQHKIATLCLKSELLTQEVVFFILCQRDAKSS